MRHVTGSAFTIARRIMFKRCFGDALLQVVVTIVTELADIFRQQLLKLGLMSSVARRTLTIFDRLVFNFCFCQVLLNVLMTLEAKFAVRFEQQLLEL